MLAACLLALSACERRPLEEEEMPGGALIRVKIDWSKTNVNTASSYTKGVHRVSLRFFPKDGRAPFDLYMEGNVTEGTILVEVGKYSVVIFNEAVDDHNYWRDAITFSDVNNYKNFAANIVPYTNALREQQFPFYKPGAGEQFIVEPLPLASWSLDNFEVTEGMVLVSYGEKPASYITAEENDMLNAFTNVVMRPLTRQLIITGQVENLASMYAGYTAMKGLATKVYMASALTTQTPATYLFMLNGRKYDAGGKNGTTNNRFLSFGRITPAGSSNESYILAADVLLISGEFYQSTPPLRFDVTNQMINNYGMNIDVNLAISFKLPYVEGAIGVDDWEDDEYELDQ